MMACRDYHDLGPDLAFRQIYEMVGGGWAKVDGAWASDCFAYYMSVACNHCERAVCMEVCPTGAMHRNGLGLVSVDARRCIGCGYCALSCPYHAPKVDRQAGCSVKCDGCTDRVAQGLAPICVEACPLRALGFAPIDELRAESWDEPFLAPLPDPGQTLPNLVLGMPSCVKREGAGFVAAEARLNNERDLVR